MTRLTFDRPSDGWLDSLPLGNGRLGAMVSGHTDGVTLHLNDGTAWSGSPASEARHPAATQDQAAQARERAWELLGAGQAVAAEDALAPLQQGYAQAYLPLAALRLRHGPAREVTRDLDLAEAVHTVQGESDWTASWRHETFISRRDGALVHRVSSGKPLDITVALTSPLREISRQTEAEGTTLGLALPADVAPSHEPDEPAAQWEVPGVNPVQVVVVVRIRHDGVPSGGAPHPTAAAEDWWRADGVRELEMVVTTETTFTGPGREPATDVGPAWALARERADAAVQTGARELRARHRRSHRQLWETASVRLGTTLERPVHLHVTEAMLSRPQPAASGDLLTALFDYGRYLLISSSAPGGLPITLQGLWNDQMRPPWSSAYTLNINLEMAYWAAAPLALGELTDPLLDFTEALERRGTETARRLYGARGWTAHHNSDAWAYTAPTNGRASWAHWALGGIWLVCTLDRRRQYGHADPSWLQRLWLLARGAAEFALDLLREGPDDALVTFPSTSPENTYLTPDGAAALTFGSGMDRALLRDLFTIVAELADLTGHRDDLVVARSRDALSRLEPAVIAPDGRVREWGQDVTDTEPDHRHLSHLLFAYPGREALDADLAGATSRTLRARGEESTGWSLAWKMALRARLGQGEQFESLLSYVLRPATEAQAHAGGLYPNLFAAHPPFQLDGNLGYTAAWCEALVHSDGEQITLLPGLPPGTPEGRAHGLRVRPGVVVSFTWTNGRPEQVHLRALASQQAGTYTLDHLGQRIDVRVPARGQLTVDWRDGTTNEEGNT